MLFAGTFVVASLFFPSSPSFVTESTEEYHGTCWVASTRHKMHPNVGGEVAEADEASIVQCQCEWPYANNSHVPAVSG